MANKKYKGKLSKTITNAYGKSLFEGQEVIAYKRSVYDENSCRTGEWEYQYENLKGNILIRTKEFLIIE